MAVDLTRRGFLAAAAGAAATTLVGCGSGELTGLENVTEVPPAEPLTGPSVNRESDRRLLMFNWEGYISPAVVRGFEKEYGIEVVQDAFSSSDEMVVRMTTGRSQYDIVFPDADTAFRLNAASMLATLDQSNIPNQRYVPDFFRTLRYDPGGLRSVPYTLYTTGIMYRTDRVGPISSWEELFDPAHSGRIGILDEWGDTLPMTLMTLALPKYRTDAANLDLAADRLISCKDSFRAFSSLPAPNMESGDFDLHHCWSGDVMQVRWRLDDPDLVSYVVPDEGTTIGSDVMVVPKGAPHQLTAERFINWMLEPEHAKQNVAWTGYAMGHTETENTLTEVDPGVPEANVTVADLEAQRRSAYSRPWSAEERKLWTWAWARVRNA